MKTKFNGKAGRLLCVPPLACRLPPFFRDTASLLPSVTIPNTPPLVSRRRQKRRARSTQSNHLSAKRRDGIPDEATWRSPLGRPRGGASLSGARRDLEYEQAAAAGLRVVGESAALGARRAHAPCTRGEFIRAPTLLRHARPSAEKPGKKRAARGGKGRAAGLWTHLVGGHAHGKCGELRGTQRAGLGVVRPQVLCSESGRIVQVETGAVVCGWQCQEGFPLIYRTCLGLTSNPSMS